MPKDCHDKHKHCSIITPKNTDVPTEKGLAKNCPPLVNPLNSDFRYNISCEAKQIFESKGISQKQLDKLKCDIGAIYPWDDLYDSLRINRTNIEVYPLAIIMTKKTTQIMEAFKFTQKYNFNFSNRGGAHNNAGYSLCNGVVIDQHLHNNINVHEKSEPTACVDAGCLNGPVIKELAKYDLALVTGTSPDTGVAGLTLGGGFSFLMRRDGLTIDNLLNIEMILANGKIVNVNANEYPDLFWACRGGGGGNFGIVLSYKYRVEKIKKACVFQITYGFSQITSVLNTWQQWAPTVDNNLTSELDISNFSGTLNVVVSGQYIGCIDKLRQLIAPLLSLAQNTTKIFIKELPFEDACKFFTGMQTPVDCRDMYNGFAKPKTSVPVVRKDYFRRRTRFAYNSWNQQTLQNIQTQMQNAPPNSELLLWALGGKIKQVSSTATAFPHRNALWFCIFSTYWQDPFKEKVFHINWLDNFYRSMEPVTKGVYVNFSDPELKDYLCEYYGENKARLIQVKAKYDPGNIFNFPQSIPIA